MDDISYTTELNGVWVNQCFVYVIMEIRPPLWSTGQSSWLQTHRSGFNSRRYQIFWVVVSLERDPLSLVSAIQELLERKRSCSGLKIRDSGIRYPSGWPRGTLYPQKLAATPPTSGGHSVCIVRSRTQATEFFFYNGNTFLQRTSLQSEWFLNYLDFMNY
jgi:hypothetical protein